MSTLLVGVDAGGTKTAAAVGDGHTILARATGPAGAIRPGRALVASSAIADTVRRALSAAGALRAGVLVVGAAGAGRDAERLELEQALRAEHLAGRVTVTTDIEIALAAAFGRKPGIVVSAGTGSIAIARDPSGAVHRAGGFGWQMGDEGSGYAVGRAALGAVSRASDGRGPRTTLSPRLLEAARLQTLDELVTWATTASPAEVAALAPAVLHAAADGDQVARGIVDYAARELGLMVAALVPHFGETGEVPVALAGGLLTPERPFRDLVERKLTDDPRLRLVSDPVAPELGALHLAEGLAAG